MAEVNLDKSKFVETLEVTIEGKKYNIPLGGSVPYGKIKKIKTDDDLINFFKEYIPEDVFETLLVKEVRTISNAWGEATKEAQGASLGE